MKALHELSIREAGHLLRSGELTARALAADALDRITHINRALHAFVLVTGEQALRDAELADRELARGVDRGLLHGIPYAVKDIYDVAGLRTTCHSRLMLHNVARENSTVVQKLSDGGAVLLGKLATHEFALGGPSFDLPFPPARNPWSPPHFCGGSSSGSAVAVAAGLTRVALGSDTSGSIRGPAFHCAVVGLKPSYGLVSRRGVFPLSYSLDHCGPLAWTVEDAACILQTIAGHDPADPASERLDAAPDYLANLDAGLHGLRIGYPRHFWMDAGCSSDVAQALDGVAQTFSRLGATVDEVSLPDFELFSACGRVIMTAEGYAIHERMLGEASQDYGRYTYQRLVPGAGLTAADLTQALRLRMQLARIVNDGVLRTHHALLVAVNLATANRVKDFPRDWSPAMSTRTIAFNVTGHPALAMPCGLARGGLPIGFQVVGRGFDEATLLRIAAAYEEATASARVRPPLATAPSPSGELHA
jgi:aspartyl-tRNA(Asn)/glutamyl-tRNA(Gln) amidotransferase subunit A